MGSWKLEVVKMFLYVMFPVASFHLFNQPEIFQEWVTKAKEGTYRTPENRVEEFRQLKLYYQKKKLEKEREAGMGI